MRSYDEAGRILVGVQLLAHTLVKLLRLADLKHSFAVGRIADSDRSADWLEVADVSLPCLNTGDDTGVLCVLGGQRNGAVVNVEAQRLKAAVLVHVSEGGLLFPFPDVRRYLLPLFGGEVPAQSGRDICGLVRGLDQQRARTAHGVDNGAVGSHSRKVDDACGEGLLDRGVVRGPAVAAFMQACSRRVEEQGADVLAQGELQLVDGTALLEPADGILLPEPLDAGFFYDPLAVGDAAQL